jgi:hypothetical protein
LLFAVINDRGPDPHRSAIADRDQVRMRCLDDGVIADPHIFANVHAAPAIKLTPRRHGAGRDASEDLQNPVSQTAQPSLEHGGNFTTIMRSDAAKLSAKTGLFVSSNEAGSKLLETNSLTHCFL